MKLGKIEPVRLRDIWDDEARDLTPWLAEPNNLKLLSEALEIDFDLEDIQKEVNVGDFSADIVTKDGAGNVVVIENQLERTDHGHLGQCITYAAGLDAKTVIWIAPSVRDEYRRAVEWLNANTSEDLGFFLVRLGAVRIGDSLPAPNFQVIESPNEWAKIMKKQSSDGAAVTETRLRQQAFFTKLREQGQKDSKRVRSWQNPRLSSEYSIALGVTGAKFFVQANARDRNINVALYFDFNDKALNRELLSQIEADREEIEAITGPLEWDNPENRRSCVIRYIFHADPANTEEANAIIPDVVEKIDEFFEAFQGYFTKKRH